MKIETKIKTNFLKTLFSLIFPTHENKIKDQTFKHKNSFKLAAKPLRKIEKLALKNYIKNSPREGIFKAFQNIAVGS